jgi:predicted nucleic acid-binding Zn ribbon protein
VPSRNDPRRPGRRAKRSDDAHGLGAVLDGLLGERPWRAGMAVGELARRWADVVGPRLSEESRPASLEGGVLLVKVSSAAWAAQIGFLAQEVVARANQVMGQALVDAVRLTVEPESAAGWGGVRPAR